MSFKIAASQGFKKGFLEAKPVLLEPIYEIEVKVPEEYMGDVMGDISSKRGKILGMDSDGRFQVIKALVPLAELYKYSTNLRSLTQGRGVHKREVAGRDLALQVYRLLDSDDRPGDEGLFLPFADGTTGSETYPAGRYVDLDGPPGRPYVLDFNRAYNP